MKITGGDGRQWRVERLRTAWRPRLPAFVVQLWSSAEVLANPVTGIASVLIVIVLLPFLLWNAASWLASLVSTPVAWLARTRMRRRWPVIAFPVDDVRAVYSGGAATVGQADALAEHVRTEVVRYGEPRSLTRER